MIDEANEFARTVLGRGRPSDTFTPVAKLHRRGDFVRFITEPDDYYAEHVSDRLTVYRSQETHRVIGCMLAGVSELVKRLSDAMPRLAYDFEGGRLQIERLVRANFEATPVLPEEDDREYDELRAVAEQYPGLLVTC